MPRLLFVLVAGLDHALVRRSPPLPVLGSLKHRGPYRPAFPAVTSTAQATLTTGALADAHGIIANGLYTHAQPDLQKQLDLTSHAAARVNVSFWEQSRSLVQSPRFWEGTGKKTAMLFWQNSMPSPAGGSPAADIVLTPKPTHTADGKTMTACWSAPGDLYPELAALLGPFPLHHYWSPMAALPSSQWIVRAAQHVWQKHVPDLQLVYIPHLDFNLLRFGPNHPAVLKDAQDIDTLLGPLVAQARADGATVVIAGDYGMSEVHTPVLPNLALRKANLLATKPDAHGKLLVDYDNSKAFVMADHQVAFLYAQPPFVELALNAITALPGVERAANTHADLQSLGLATPRAGQAVLLASPTAWFAHDYWLSDDEKPAWQFSVDIHNKPGFDSRELFFDPQKKCIAQNLTLPKGSHALTDDPEKWPIILSDAPLPAAEHPQAVHIAPWLKTLLTR